MLNTSGNDVGQEAERRAEEAAEEASPWVERLARVGYVTKGAVYIVVGALAVGVATGVGGRTADPHAALEIIGEQPLGWLLLVLVAVGLAGYALWRLVQATADPDGEGHNAKGIARGVGHAGAALIYGGLAFSAGQLMLAFGGSGFSPKDWTAWLLSWPFGQVLVSGVGAGVVVYGLSQIYQAYKADFLEYLKLGQMSNRTEAWITHGGRFGVAARAAVFGIVGLFLILAALQSEPNEARGLGGALHALLLEPFGPWLLGAVALGLIAYGLLMLAMAYYGRIAPERASS